MHPEAKTPPAGSWFHKRRGKWTMLAAGWSSLVGGVGQSGSEEWTASIQRSSSNMPRLGALHTDSVVDARLLCCAQGTQQPGPLPLLSSDGCNGAEPETPSAARVPSPSSFFMSSAAPAQCQTGPFPEWQTGLCQVRPDVNLMFLKSHDLTIHEP